MKTRAPGKLILSGEHAVVYGQPALVMALNRFATCEITSRKGVGLLFDLPDFHHSVLSSPEEIINKQKHLDIRYQQFLSGSLPIEDVAPQPSDLLEYATAGLLKHLKEKGLHIRLSSDIPIGCGMGSSAAVLVSFLSGLSAFLGLPDNRETLYPLALQCEKLQHGYPSGIDPYASLHGGLLVFQEGDAHRIGPADLPICLIHTGTPDTTTGQCVSHVASHIGSDDPIWKDFASVEQSMEGALLSRDTSVLRKLIAENHRLLCKLGVVPKHVQAFIRVVEQHGGAAKICGAGATSGDGGGLVWALTDTPPLAICEKFGYTMTNVKGEQNGVRIV